MPPRIPNQLLQGLLKDNARSCSAKPQPQNYVTRSFSTTFSALHKSPNRKPNVYRDPWLIKQQQVKREALLARRKVHAERKAEGMGDPIRGAAQPTPFVESFDKAMDPGYHFLKRAGTASDTASETATGQSAEGAGASRQPALLNHFLTSDVLASSLEASREFSAPYVPLDRSLADPAREQEQLAQHAQQHAKCLQAVTRILAPENASAPQRLLLNKRRIIDRFGRHNTDLVLGGRTPAAGQVAEAAAGRRERIGPDTGSSEVQIAILTAKIRALAGHFQSHTGRFDWVNKRNLRILLHRRQKLLKYFEKKDRGGPRWQHLIETLGLSEATWKGQIEVR